jgi:antitoxin component YwqK of YwqJK toxin-antitoxin module
MGKMSANTVRESMRRDYRHFFAGLWQSVGQFDGLEVTAGYDSLSIVYADDMLKEFYGYEAGIQAHCHIRYYEPDSSTRIVVLPGYEQPREQARIMAIGQYSAAFEKTGVWKHYDESGQLYKTENFIIPRREDDEIKYISSTKLPD